MIIIIRLLFVFSRLAVVVALLDGAGIANVAELSELSRDLLASYQH